MTARASLLDGVSGALIVVRGALPAGTAARDLCAAIYRAETDGAAGATFGVPVEREVSYPLEGTYTVDLEVTDNNGGSGRDGLTLTVLNRDPSCATATPTIASLWAPNHKPVPVGVTGLTDPEGDDLRVTVTGVRQDEPVRETGSGRTGPDASGVPGRGSVRPVDRYRPGS